MADVSEKLLNGAGLAEVWRVITEFVDDSDEAVLAQVASLYSKIQTGSYAATANSGTNYPSSLTFDFVPKVVMVHSLANKTAMIIFTQELTSTLAVCGALFTSSSRSLNAGYGQNAALSGTTLSWYGSSAEYQMNESGKTYTWVAFG